MKKTSAFLLLICLFACVRSKQNAVPARFKKPVIVQAFTPDSTQIFSYDFMQASAVQCVGRSSAADTLTFYTADYHLNHVLRDSDIVHPRLIGLTDSAATDGLEIVTDYGSKLDYDWLGTRKIYQYYPVYVVNQTPDTKILEQSGSYGIGIQEALDATGVWRPIEFQRQSSCIIGLHGLKLRPQEYAVLLFARYQGNFKTKLRVRIKNGDNVYVSRPFDGTINEGQFHIEPNEYIKEMLDKHKVETVVNYFYSACPVEAGKIWSY